MTRNYFCRDQFQRLLRISKLSDQLPDLTIGRNWCYRCRKLWLCKYRAFLQNPRAFRHDQHTQKNWKKKLRKDTSIHDSLLIDCKCAKKRKTKKSQKWHRKWETKWNQNKNTDPSKKSTRRQVHGIACLFFMKQCSKFRTSRKCLWPRKCVRN